MDENMEIMIDMVDTKIKKCTELVGDSENNYLFLIALLSTFNNELDKMITRLEWK